MANEFLHADHFPGISSNEKQKLASELDSILQSDLNGSMFELLAGYQRILADNGKRDAWNGVYEKLRTLFMCGRGIPIDGPMIGVTVSIRDSDYFRSTAQRFGRDRSIIANIEMMATTWNMTFADTGFWMGKTFEPVSQEAVAELTSGNTEAVAAFNPDTTRIGRNYFREPANADPNLLQRVGLPALTRLWNLEDRPTLDRPEIFHTRLSPENSQKEENIPYSKTGGLFLADMGKSVVPEMNGKTVYQLNYRWPRLKAVYPMTRLVDEIVKIEEGIYLGQLVFATRNYGLTTTASDSRLLKMGKEYNPFRRSFIDVIRALFSRRRSREKVDYGYQNNGYFLMLDPAYAREIYADNAFPQLEPQRDEKGYVKV